MQNEGFLRRPQCGHYNMRILLPDEVACGSSSHVYTIFLISLLNVIFQLLPFFSPEQEAAVHSGTKLPVAH